MSEQPAQMQRICLVATTPLPLVVFMGPHIKALKKNYDITIVTNGDAGLDSMGSFESLLDERTSYIKLRLVRRVSVFADLLTLIELWRLFRCNKFEIVHSITPKAGLLAMAAGLLAGVPIRIHWLTGQVWVTRNGYRRWVLKNLDRLIVAFSTHLLADSHSQNKFLIQEGVVRPNQVNVFGDGSVCGVDIDRFKPNPISKSKIRNELGIPSTAIMVIYLGRLNPDKGIPELATALLLAMRKCVELHFLLAGPDEGGMQSLVARTLSSVADRVHFIGFTKEPETFMASADFFILPSHREGFGSSVIEAAACGIPSIASQIYGLMDAIVDGKTGLLVPVGDVAGIADAIVKLVTNQDLRLTLGRQALERVRQDFKQERLTDALLDFYIKCLKKSYCEK